jgi:WD40 repeat protein
MGWLSWWNLASATEEGSRQAFKNSSLYTPAVSPDGQLFATVASDSEVRLWNAATRTAAGILRGFLLGAHSVAFSPDGDRLVAGSGGQEAVKIWDLATQQELLTFAGSGNLFAFTRCSPDGNTILSINDEHLVHLWRAPSWAEIEAAEAKGPPSPGSGGQEKVETKQP